MVESPRHASAGHKALHLTCASTRICVVSDNSHSAALILFLYVCVSLMYPETGVHAEHVAMWAE